MHAKNTKYTFIRYKNINKIYTRHTNFIRNLYMKYMKYIYSYMHMKKNYISNISNILSNFNFFRNF